jgi:cyclic-di-AMP phosphodiesterase PgpH
MNTHKSEKRPNVGSAVAQELNSATGRKRIQQWLGVVLAFLICVVALTREPTKDMPLQTELGGNVSSREIRAQFYFETPDLARTAEAKKQEAAKVPDYFRIDRNSVIQQIQLLRERIARLRDERDSVTQAIIEALRASTEDQTVDSLVTRVVSAHATALKENPDWTDFPEPDLLALWLTPDIVSLPERDFSVRESPKNASEKGNPETAGTRFLIEPPEPVLFQKSDIMEKIALEGLEYVLMKGIRQEIPAPAFESRRIVIMRDQALGDLPLTTELTFSEVLTVEMAKEELDARLTDTAQRAAREMSMSDRWARMHDAAFALAQHLVVVTLQEDKIYTEGARARAREAVPPVIKEIEAGEIVQDRGRRWTEQSRSDVETYLSILANDEQPLRRTLNTMLAHIMLVFLVFLGIHKRVHFKQTYSQASPTTAFNLALLLLCSILVLGRVISYFEPTGYVLPVATAGILYAILVGPQRAALFGALAAALVSAQYQYNWRLLLVAGAMTIAGSFSIYGVRKRSDMTAAAIVATLVGILATCAAILATDTLFGDLFFRRIFLILLNGALCLLAAPGVLPWLEKLFGITTDMQLLEYSDLNNELLRKLALAAPATYAHSLLLGQIAEAAADAIGANGLLARVCAYYHDIGKGKNPDYFTENQSGQKNVHDSLPPLVSVRKIRQHVVEGVREAQDHKLPQPIINGILEHHGTCKIGFFYEKAQEQNPEMEFPETEFRYPGPKPQRPETAILMICDASESGVRSLENPTLETVRKFVGKIIRARSDDNQFEDCNLTLRQLTQIRDVVAKALTNAMHTRVAYPDQEKGNR